VNGNTRQRNLWIALVVVVLIATLRLVVSLLGFEGDDALRDTPPRPGRAHLERIGTRPGDRIAVLRTADLERAPLESRPGRDPWGFVDPPSLHPRPADLRVPIAEAAQPAPQEDRADLGKTRPPSPAEFNLRYLGRFGPPDKQIAVFASGKGIVNTLEGDVIDDKFIVAHIGHESVEIRFVGFPDVPAKRVGVTPRR
jgi:hypothetical protein